MLFILTCCHKIVSYAENDLNLDFRIGLKMEKLFKISIDVIEEAGMYQYK